MDPTATDAEAAVAGTQEDVPAAAEPVAASESDSDDSDSDSSSDEETQLDAALADAIGLQVVQNMCFRCHETGVTNVFRKNIPFFSEVIIMAFRCKSCGARDSFIEQSEVGDEAVEYVLKVSSDDDLKRQVVKSKWAVVQFPELGLEIPATNTQGTFTTVEGMLRRMVDGLSSDQAKRAEVNPEQFVQMKQFLATATMMLSGLSFPFTMQIQDLSGNSFVENPNAPNADPLLRVNHFKRSKAHNEALGMFAGNALEEGAGAANLHERPDNFIASAAFEGEKAGFVFTTRNGQTGYYLDTFQMVLEREAHAGFEGSRAGEDGSGQSRVTGSQNQADDVGVGGGSAPGAGAGGAGTAGAGAGAGAGADGALESKTEAPPDIDPSTVAGALFKPEEGAPAGKEVGDTVVVRDDDTGEATGVRFSSSSDTYHTRELMRFDVVCNACHEPGKEIMVQTDIPYFQEIIIMSFKCDNCGFKSTDIKTGGEIGPKGRSLTLVCEPGEHMQQDLNRDLIKSDSADVDIVGLGFEQLGGTVPGMYTTVEGLLSYYLNRMESNPFVGQTGDSRTDSKYDRFQELIAKLRRMRAGEESFTLVLRDPLARSWIHSPYAPKPDPRLTVEDYTRSAEEEEYLGLADMVAPDGEDEEAEAKSADVVSGPAPKPSVLPEGVSPDIPIGSVDAAAAKAATERRQQ